MIQGTRRGVMLGGAAALAAGPRAFAAEGTAVYAGGPILTMDDARPRAQAVAVRGGRILAVGDRDEVLAKAGRGARLVDLDGRALLPGFVDPHGHVSFVGLQAVSANLLPAPDGEGNSIPDLQRIVRAADAAGLAGDAKISGSYGGGFSIDALRGISRGDVPDGARNVDLAGLTPWRTTELVKNAKTLHCSVDYLLGLTDEINSTAAVSGQVALAAWMPGGTTPAEPCDVVAEFDLSGDGELTSRSLCRWDGEAFRFGKSRDKIEVRVVRWLALPEVEKEDGNDD